MDWEKVKIASWGAVGGAVALAIVGFAWGGWVTGGTAQQRANELAENAVVDRLALICVKQFGEDLEKDQKLVEMNKKNSWDRDTYVEEQGWATMPDEEKPENSVARKCAVMLAQLKQ